LYKNEKKLEIRKAIAFLTNDPLMNEIQFIAQKMGSENRFCSIFGVQSRNPKKRNKSIKNLKTIL
jgi:hypothetical protein